VAGKIRLKDPGTTPPLPGGVTLKVSDHGLEALATTTSTLWTPEAILSVAVMTPELLGFDERKVVHLPAAQSTFNA
jgi:hypothetical protein